MNDADICSGQGGNFAGYVGAQTAKGGLTSSGLKKNLLGVQDQVFFYKKYQ